jgi:diadenosine tetraphosphatase ApaH/serine/threonine PP2A family protein phosphatase
VRYGIFSDVHANLEALDAILSHLDRLSVDRLVCLGDVVGYGADPCACLDRIRERDVICVAGNHDVAAADGLNIELFNSYAADSIRWTRSQIREEDRVFLRDLPFVITDDRVSLAHSTLHCPTAFDYLRTPQEALRSFEAFTTRAAFIGHSHTPIVYALWKRSLLVNFDSSFSLRSCLKAIFNVGSVGQPRDHDPRASCAVYDAGTEDYSLHRVAYDIDRAAAKILGAGLPAVLAERLRVGI